MCLSGSACLVRYECCSDRMRTAAARCSVPLRYVRAMCGDTGGQTARLRSAVNTSLDVHDLSMSAPRAPAVWAPMCCDARQVTGLRDDTSCDDTRVQWWDPCATTSVVVYDCVIIATQQCGLNCRARMALVPAKASKQCQRGDGASAKRENRYHSVFTGCSVALGAVLLTGERTVRVRSPRLPYVRRASIGRRRSAISPMVVTYDYSPRRGTVARPPAQARWRHACARGTATDRCTLVERCSPCWASVYRSLEVGR